MLLRNIAVIYRCHFKKMCSLSNPSLKIYLILFIPNLLIKFDSNKIKVATKLFKTYIVVASITLMFYNQSYRSIDKRERLNTLLTQLGGWSLCDFD